MVRLERRGNKKPGESRVFCFFRGNGIDGLKFCP